MEYSDNLQENSKRGLQASGFYRSVKLESNNQAVSKVPQPPDLLQAGRVSLSGPPALGCHVCGVCTRLVPLVCTNLGTERTKTKAEDLENWKNGVYLFVLASFFLVKKGSQRSAHLRWSWEYPWHHSLPFKCRDIPQMLSLAAHFSPP